MHMVSAIKRLGMETCATLGMLTPIQAVRLADAELDFYNHNVDTSPEFYGTIIITHTLQDRIDTLTYVRDAGIKGCCDGIIDTGERPEDRLSMLVFLANFPVTPKACRSTSGTRSKVCRSRKPQSVPIRSR